MRFNDYKFRCSSLGHLMTEPRSKSEKLSETTKTHLIDCYISKVFDRRNEITNKFLEKGVMVEENSIDLLSLYTGNYYRKNKKRYVNDFIQGTPDIVEDQLVIDIKSNYDIYTFGRSRDTENKMYYWQLQGYMWLTGIDEAELVYCLVNTPEYLIKKEAINAVYKAGINPESEEYDKYLEELTKFYTYDDIDPSKRIITKTYTLDLEAIEKLKQRIIDCREHMNSINW